MNDCHGFLTGNVSGSGTGSPDSESRDLVPDLESGDSESRGPVPDPETTQLGLLGVGE